MSDEAEGANDQGEAKGVCTQGTIRRRRLLHDLLDELSRCHLQSASTSQPSHRQGLPQGKVTPPHPDKYSKTSRTRILSNSTTATN